MLDLSHHSNYFFTDVETSGGDPDKFGVISCASLITDHNLNVIQTFERLIKPPFFSRHTWDLEAAAVHKIPFEKVWYEGISYDQFCYDLLRFVGQYRPQTGYMPFVCHASKHGMRKRSPPMLDDRGKKMKQKDLGTYQIWPKFDYHFIERAMRRAYFEGNIEMVWTFWKLFHPDESFMSTVMMGRAAGYKVNRLDEWAERLRFPLNHHDAMSDTLCCLEIFRKLRNVKVDYEDAKIHRDDNGELEVFFGYEGENV